MNQLNSIEEIKERKTISLTSLFQPQKWTQLKEENEELAALRLVSRSINYHSFRFLLHELNKLNSMKEEPLKKNEVDFTLFVCSLAPLLVELFVFVLFLGRSHWRCCAHNPPTKREDQLNHQITQRAHSLNKRNWISFIGSLSSRWPLID